MPGRTVALGPFEIDRQAVRWAEFLPFVEAGGYTQPQWWSEATRAWRAATGAEAPRYTRRSGPRWQQWRHGQWRELDLRREGASASELAEAMQGFEGCVLRCQPAATGDVDDQHDLVTDGLHDVNRDALFQRWLNLQLLLLREII